jgi:cytochrome c-type biogenesis protein CcmH/NrfF
MRNAVLDWANQGKTQGDIAQLMVNRRWVGTNTAPKWTAQMIEQLTVPSLI